ncbi:MAG: LLM class flavin-dependent oxidoreductase [Bacteroidota bacterium]
MKNIDVGLYCYMSHDLSLPNQYDLMKDVISYADQEGFKFVWVVDGYFQSTINLQLNPAVLHSALSVITSSVSLRGECMISTFRDVLREAEEWSVIDNLSNGRAGLALYTVSESGQPIEETIAYMKNLKDLWKGHSVQRKNGLGEEIEVKIFPRPIQEESPVWIPLSAGKSDFSSLGASGANLLTILKNDVKELKSEISLYRAAAEKEGFGKSVVTVISNNENTVSQPLRNYLKRSMNLEDSVTFGEKSSLSEKLLNQVAESGADELACLVDLTQGRQKIFESLQQLSEKLLQKTLQTSA